MSYDLDEYNFGFLDIFIVVTATFLFLLLMGVVIAGILVQKQTCESYNLKLDNSGKYCYEPNSFPLKVYPLIAIGNLEYEIGTEVTIRG